jgi:site-specific DNA-methyltransferase (adenine-specific)
VSDCCIILGDCAHVLPSLEADSFDGIVTDPPAGIAFMGKSWDKDRGGRDSWITWMSSIAAECLRVAKPGAHALVWAIPRTSHWTATAWENAGWEIRDRIGHLFASGFPKSLNLGPVGTALKPACEDWWLMRKPLAGTVAENLFRFGTGGISIDACRIGTETVGWQGGRGGSDDPAQSNSRNYRLAEGEPRPVTGRWPANITHDGSDEVLAVFPESDGQLASNRGCSHNNGSVEMNSFPMAGQMDPRNDSGSASRFFFCSKATRRDREEGLDDFAPKQMDESRDEDAPGANNPRNRGGEGRKNHHPTVKSTELMRWLVRLVTPIDGIVLDPFAGSGSTGKACVFERRGFIGIEQDPEFVAIAAARIDWARKHLRREQLSMFAEALP